MNEGKFPLWGREIPSLGQRPARSGTSTPGPGVSRSPSGAAEEAPSTLSLSRDATPGPVTPPAPPSPPHPAAPGASLPIPAHPCSGRARGTGITHPGGVWGGGNGGRLPLTASRRGAAGRDIPGATASLPGSAPSLWPLLSCLLPGARRGQRKSAGPRRRREKKKRKKNQVETQPR